MPIGVYIRKLRPLADRFWPKIDIRGPDECWPWKASNVKGYGQLRVGTKLVLAHRLAYELVKGPIPAGMDVLHKCDYRPCCNPEHLFPGTQLDNMQDAATKGRTARGERNGTHTHPEMLRRGERHGAHTHPERTARGENQGSAKLTETKVYDVRRLFAGGKTKAEIARLMDVSRHTIGKVVNGQTWRHVTEQQRFPVIEGEAHGN
jgi:hypothetical protein